MVLLGTSVFPAQHHHPFTESEEEVFCISVMFVICLWSKTDWWWWHALLFIYWWRHFWIIDQEYQSIRLLNDHFWSTNSDKVDLKPQNLGRSKWQHIETHLMRTHLRMAPLQNLSLKHIFKLIRSDKDQMKNLLNVQSTETRLWFSFFPRYFQAASSADWDLTLVIWRSCWREDGRKHRQPYLLLKNSQWRYD